MSADANDIGAMLRARAAEGAAPAGATAAQTGDIGALLAQRAAGADVYTPPPAPPKAPAPTAGSRFAQGITDLPTGLGQIAEHVAETPLNGVRAVIRGGLEAAGAKDAASLFAPVKTGEFDDIVQKREQDYQQARTDAQQTGIDWWRLGGQAANPLNYAMPGAGASTVLGRIGAGAAQGAAVSAGQPSTTPGSFWWDKAKNAVVGALTGGAISGVVEAAIPAVRAAFSAIKNTIGTAKASLTPAADAMVNSALASKNIDPQTIDVNVLAGLKQEAQSALEHDAEPSAEAVVNRARAESLPFPIRLTRGQATGDAMQFSKEQNLRGVTGVGEPITQRLTEQNKAMLANLDALGAKNAPDPVSTGQKVSDTVQGFWDQVDAKKKALYDAVKNSKGQPAAMDQFTAAQQIKDTLDTPQASHAYDLLPDNIKRTVDDLHDGKLPLTVGQMQSLDKIWGAQARGADGSVAYAINTARRILNDAPIADDVGLEAKQAYQAAKQAHAQQMSLVEPKLPNGQPNPNYQPLVKSVVMDGAPPEKLFQQHFMGAAPSVAAKNLAFVKNLDPTAPEAIGKTFMGEVKRLALSNASDERGTISNSVLSGFANDPVKAARMEALMPDPAVQTYRNLAASVEVAKRFPVAHAVNTSNTGSAVVNAGVSMLKQSALAQVARRLPGVKMVADAKNAAAMQTGVQEALQPGVTLKSLLTSTPAQAARRRAIGRASIPISTAATDEYLDLK